METMTDTPNTSEALAALLDRDGELSEENAPEVLVKLCRAMERERDEARQWESQALVARIQRDEFLKTLGEVREILCEALPNENQLTSSMAVKLARERDEARVLADNLAEALNKACANDTAHPPHGRGKTSPEE